jgi:hypothetical protein
MYCENCGAQLGPNVTTCPSCGYDQATEEASISEPNSLGSGNSSNPVVDNTTNHFLKSRRVWLWSSVGTAAILVAVGGYFGVTTWLGNKDNSLANAAAQQGNFALALADQKEAVHWNSRNTNLKQRLGTYQLGMRVTQLVSKADGWVKNQDYSTAIHQYQNAKSLLTTSTPLFDPITSRINTGLEHANVGQIEQNSTKTSDVSTIASNYVELTKYTDPYGKAAQKTVQYQLESLVTKQVQQNIKADDFTDASSVVQTALQSIPNDSTLNKLQQDVKSAQKAYEQRQQQIEEASLAQQANITNLNANPINVVNVNLSSDGMGDTVASGTIEDQGTNNIGSITLTVDFTDPNGNLVDTEYVGVTPDPLSPGQQATFSVSIPDIYGATTASVTYANWLNE